PEGDVEPPERDWFGPAGEAAGSQEDRLESADLIEPVLRHHAAGLGVSLAVPVERREGALEAEAPPGRLQHAQTLGHHLVADAVAGNHGDLVSHRVSPRSVGYSPR